MDEDAKTLMAVLALIYGSSNGVGLFKTALDPIVAKTATLENAMNDPRADSSYVVACRSAALSSLRKLNVVIYVLLVLVPTFFLVIVVWAGPDDALEMIGLGAGTDTNRGRGSVFYWILLTLSLLSSVQLLSSYLKGWRAAYRSWRREGEEE